MQVYFSQLTLEDHKKTIRNSEAVVAYDLTRDGGFDFGTGRQIWGKYVVPQNSAPGTASVAIGIYSVGVRPGTSDFDNLRKLVREVCGFDDLQKGDDTPSKATFVFIGGSLGLGRNEADVTHMVELQPNDNMPPNTYRFRRPDGTVEEYSFRRINGKDSYFYKKTVNG